MILKKIDQFIWIDHKVGVRVETEILSYDS